MVQNKALFLDRDGVINVDTGYVFKIEDFSFVGSIFDLTRYYQERGYIIIVVTNQSGIGRGYYSEEQFQDLSVWMVGEFSKHGIRIEKVYHCPHHPDLECACRKPKPGMILQAAQDFNINLATSIMIGDKETDLIAGQSAGVGNNLLIGDAVINLIGFQNKIY